MGHRKTTRPLYQAVISEDVANSDGRVYVVRVRAWRETAYGTSVLPGPRVWNIYDPWWGANGLALSQEGLWG